MTHDINSTPAATQTERVRVKLYFDLDNVCLGGCAEYWWLNDYSGDYAASEFFKLTPGYNPIGQTVKQLQEVQAATNPYKIAATAAAAIRNAKLAKEKTTEIAALEATGLESRAMAELKAEKNAPAPVITAPAEKVKPLQTWEIKEAKKIKKMMERNSYIKKTVQYTLAGYDLNAPYVCESLNFNRSYAQSSFDAIAKVIKPFKSMTLAEYLRMIMR